jgi:hypothetical protein
MRMLRHFLYAWLLYWGAVLVLPVHSLYPATTEAFLLQLSFAIIVTASAGCVLFAFRVREMPEAGRFDMPSAATLCWIAIAFSVAGLASLIFDKIAVQGIDYSSGLAAARNQWRDLGEEREGQVSSIFSVIGYFFGSGYYAATVLAITQTRVLTARQRLVTLLICFVLLVLNSALTGGRSSLLLIAPMAISAYSARRAVGTRTREKKQKKETRQWRVIKLLAVVALAYVIFIFYQRASATDLGILNYALDFLPFLGIEADTWYTDSLNNGALSSLSAILVLTMSYVTHSFATVAAIIDAPDENKTIVFTHAFGMLYKLGLIAKPDTDWFLAGRLPSLPGALWHQFGVIGFVAGSVSLGITAALTTVWTIRRPSRLFPLGAYTLAETILMLSPALFAADFLSFPFVLISFVTLALLDRIIRIPIRQSVARPAVAYSAPAPN